MARTKLEIKMEYDRKYRNFQKVLRRARKQGLVINVDYQKPQEITEGSIRRLDKVAEDVKYDLERQRIQKAREGRNLLREEQERTKRRRTKRKLAKRKKQLQDLIDAQQIDDESKRMEKARSATDIILKNIESNLLEIENELKTAEGLISHAAMLSANAYKTNILQKCGLQLDDIKNNKNSDYSRMHGPVLYSVYNAKIMHGTQKSKDAFCQKYLDNVLDWEAAVSILRYGSDSGPRLYDMIEAYKRIMNLIMDAAGMKQEPNAENGIAEIPEYLEYTEAPDSAYYGEEFF